MGVWLRRRSPARPRPSFSHCPPGSPRGGLHVFNLGDLGETLHVA